MYTHGVHVLDKAYSDHLVPGIPDHLQLQLFPPRDRLLDEHLTYEAGGNSTARYGPQLLGIVDQPSAGTSHGVGRPYNNRVSEICCHNFCVFQSVDRGAPGNLDSQGVHGLLEDDPILAALDGVELHSNDFDLELIQNTCPGQFKAQVEAVLAAQIGQEGIRPLLFNDLSQAFYVQRLDVGCICRAWIGHNCGRVGVHKNYFVSQSLERLAGLVPE